MTEAKKVNPILSEPFLLLSLLATIILIVQDVNGILQMEIWADPLMWWGLLKGTVRYFVVFLMGILSHLYKKIQEKLDENNKTNVENQAREKQTLASGFTSLRDKCLASNNPDLVSAAKDASLAIVNQGVDLFIIAQEREIQLLKDAAAKTLPGVPAGPEVPKP
jgi:uncharacterized membrane protein